MKTTLLLLAFFCLMPILAHAGPYDYYGGAAQRSADRAYGQYNSGYGQRPDNQTAQNDCVGRRRISCDKNDKRCARLMGLYEDTATPCPRAYGYDQCVQSTARLCESVKDLERELQR